MKPLAILFLGTQMTIGGAQQVLFSQASWFHRQGYAVRTAFFYDKDDLQAHWAAKYPYPVINLQGWQDGGHPLRNGFNLIFALCRLWRLLRREKIDVIETFTPDTNLLGLFVARLAGVPVRIASHHGVIAGRSPWFTKLHTRLINWGFADRLVVVSERVRQIAIDEDGIRPAQVTIILNGIEPFDAAQLPADTRPRLLAELQIREGQFIILTVGRVTGQKGHTYLLDAIPEVLARFPDAVFVLAGDGPLREALQAKAQQMGLESHLLFLGTRLDVPALLSIADLFVLPSISEGMPIALLEAMDLGVPVVASRLDQIAAFVADQQHGLLVMPKDVCALSEAILCLLEDAALRQRLGQAGQALVRECYTVDPMCRKYEHLFLGCFKCVEHA